MNDLNKFVDAWEKTGNIETIICQGLALPPSEEVQIYLSSLSETERSRVNALLTEALTALSLYAETMEKDAVSLKAQIDQTVQVSNACLTYNNSSRTPRK